MSYGDRTGMCDMKSWVLYVTEEIVRFSPMSVIDGGAV
jgi:hypothetical protein